MGVRKDVYETTKLNINWNLKWISGVNLIAPANFTANLPTPQVSHVAKGLKFVLIDSQEPLLDCGEAQFRFGGQISPGMPSLVPIETFSGHVTMLKSIF